MKKWFFPNEMSAKIHSMLNSMVHWTRAIRFAALDPALNNLDYKYKLFEGKIEL